MKNTRTLILLLLLGLSATEALAQNSLNVTSDRVRRIRRVSGDVLTGNVRFIQGETIVRCDSAVYFKSQDRLNAFGNVRIVNRADTVTITARELYYDAGSQQARMRKDVVYRGPDFTLTTDFLDYNMATKKARYNNGGRVRDRQMNLTSTFGDFDPGSGIMIFRRNVELIDPQGKVNSDYLRYDTNEKMAYFEGHTTIDNEDGVIIVEEGAQYNTETQEFFGTSTEIVDGDFTITGDKSAFVEGFRRITGNVRVFSEADSVTVTGDEALYSEESGLTLIYGHALLEKPFGQDTLWLAADTLVSYKGDSLTDKKMVAYNQVRIFKSDLQGVADSLIYNFTDSTIYFYEHPAIWSDGTQITGDSIHILLGQGVVHQLNAYQNSFLVSQVAQDRYNQIKGRVMISHFVDNKISTMNVEGNGESIYFQVEQPDSIVTGMNKMVCSHMKLTFTDGSISRIKFYQNPEASFIPVHEISPSAVELDGFEWRGWQRPTRNAVVLSLAPPTNPADAVTEALETLDEGAPTATEGAEESPAANQEGAERPVRNLQAPEEGSGG